ncbi:phage tail tube protein [Vibrio cholerae]|uniref:phage tail tube protein n=1 Tax=Vibrio cholerae TaxID=666 RepID=UPI0021C95343|nr:phage tail tube protein [Vibrio cholerae]
MANVLGEVVIRSNGKQLKTKKGSTLNPGGFNYIDHPGPGRSWELLASSSRQRFRSLLRQRKMWMCWKSTPFATQP